MSSTSILDSDDSSTVGVEEEDQESFTDAQQQPRPYEETQDDAVMIRERDAQPPMRNQNNETLSQEVSAIFRLLGDNGNNNNNLQENKEEEEEEEEVQVVTLSAKETRYPKCADFMTKHPEAVLQLFKAVDDVGCTSCTQASDRAGPKGNAWAKLLDVCHGGGSLGRGSMSRFGFTGLTKVTGFKKKVLEYWDFGLDNKEKVLPEIYDYCVRQKNEHMKAKTEEKENSSKQKDVAQKQQQQMVQYQEFIGARPPGAGRVTTLPPAARGVPGAGRGQHSTNLVTGQPATFAFAHLRSENQNVSPLSTATGTNAGVNTGSDTSSNNTGSNNSNPRTPGRHSPTRGTATIHNNALSSITSTKSSIDSLVGNFLSRGTQQQQQQNAKGSKRDRKIERLEKKAKKLKADIQFYKEIGDQDEYKKSLDLFKANSDLLNTVYDESSDEEDNNN